MEFFNIIFFEFQQDQILVCLLKFNRISLKMEKRLFSKNIMLI